MSREDYMRGRADERASIVGWLEAEAADETLPSYANAYRMMATALSHIVPTSEMVGLDVRPMAVGGEGL